MPEAGVQMLDTGLGEWRLESGLSNFFRISDLNPVSSFYYPVSSFYHPVSSFPVSNVQHPVSVRLACVRHAASVRPEPGSNSLLFVYDRALAR